MKRSISLLVILSFTFLTFSQNSYHYVVDSIPYQTYQEQDVVQFSNDDRYSDVITAPFLIDFFEEPTTNQFVIGTNGGVTFDVNEANQGQSWILGENLGTSATEDPVYYTVPSMNVPFPSIFGAFHDMDNSSGVGVIYTGITGNAPHRRFHITYENNPQFFSTCNPLLSTCQIVIHETSGIIDVIITDKPVCPIWNGGLAVIGLQAMVGGEIKGIAAPDRNTSAWVAEEEAWRFVPVSFLNGFNVAICDTDNDDSEMFNIDDYKASIFGLFNLDATANTIEILDNSDIIVSGDVTVLAGNDLPQNSYTIDINNGEKLFDMTIALVNCEDDGDTDGLTNGEEDVNNNGNLNDDDTDGDGIPNYLDDDDDGDSVLTNIELVFADRNASSAATLDTDGDGIPNHLDFDDDGDGIFTLDEDYNGNGDPTDDDTNDNGTPDYLDVDVLNVDAVSLNSSLFTVYPIPAKSDINVQFSENIGFEGSELMTRIYDIQGRLVLEQSKTVLDSKFNIDISQLNSGNYILLIQKDGLTRAKKFVIE